MNNEKKWNEVDRSFNEAAGDVFPGAVLMVARPQGVEYVKAYGWLTHERKERLKEDAVFDLASLTKPVCSVSCMMLLQSGKMLDIADPLSTYFKPNELANGLEKASIKDLLAHQSGMKSYYPFYEDVFGKSDEAVSPESARGSIFKRVREETLSYECGGGFEYSDLGYILICEIAERITGKRLDELCREMVLDPIGMKYSSFIPLGEDGSGEIFKGRQIAPTQFYQRLGQEALGVVDDENCQAMGGVSGHAGLFSCADDLAAFVKEIFRGYAGKSDIFPKEVCRDFFRRVGKVKDSPWALRWKTPSKGDSSYGNNFTENTIGHLGFTGCSVWIDLSCEFGVLLLSNRVNPSSKNVKIRQFRPVIHDLVTKVIKGM